MKIVMTLLCRDEADIIGENIEYHLAHGVDAIIVTDNGSTDQTLEIIQGFSRSGRVHLLQEPEHNHDQAIWVSRMANLACRDHDADWLVHSDADEFWVADGNSLKKTLAALAASTEAVSIERKNYLAPRLEDDNGKVFYQLQTIREQFSLNAHGHPLPPKVIHRSAGEIWVEDGNHSVQLNGRAIAPTRCDTIQIHHFPVRSYQQFERKILQGAQALERNQRIRPEIGSTWRVLADEHARNGNLYQSYGQLSKSLRERDSGIQAGTLVVDSTIRSYFMQGAHS